MALTYAQKLAFSETIVQFIHDHEAELKKEGFDPRQKLTSLEKSRDLAIKLDTQQETLKAELVKQTGKAVEALNDLYKQASSMTDAMTGLVGKDTPLAKRLKQLRDQMALEAARGKRSTGPM